MNLKSWRNVAWACAVCAPLTLGTGCVKHNTGSSAVAQGQRYKTGKSDYDVFFSSVHRLQLDVERAPSSVRDTQSALAQRLQAKSSEPTQLGQKMRAELDRLAARGVNVRVELRGADALDPAERKAQLTTPSKPKKADAELVTEFERSLAEQWAIIGSMRKARMQLDALGRAALHLEERVDTSFTGRFEDQRDEAVENLRDAERLLALMRARCDETEQNAAAFVEGFTRGSGITLPERGRNAEAERLVRIHVTAPAEGAAEKAEERGSSASPPRNDAVTRADFDP